MVCTLKKWLAHFEEGRTCTPAESSKFRGVTSFASQATFNNLLKPAARPFTRRQCIDVPPWRVSGTMDRASAFIRVILEQKPKRRVQLHKPAQPALVIASDAHVGPETDPGGGALLWDPVGGTKLGISTVLDDVGSARSE